VSCLVRLPFLGNEGKRKEKREKKKGKVMEPRNLLQHWGSEKREPKKKKGPLKLAKKKNRLGRCPPARQKKERKVEGERENTIKWFVPAFMGKGKEKSGRKREGKASHTREGG